MCWKQQARIGPNKVFAYSGLRHKFSRWVCRGAPPATSKTGNILMLFSKQNPRDAFILFYIIYLLYTKCSFTLHYGAIYTS